MTEPAQFGPMESITTPIRANSPRLEVLADCFPLPIPLDVLQTHYLPTQVLHADPLVLMMADNAYVVVLRFGAVIFWQCDARTCLRVVESILQLPDMRPPNTEVRDRLVVLVDQSEDRVDFRDIRLRALTLEHLRIISATIGQSVALKQCELSVGRTLKQTAPIIEALEQRGALIPSSKNILKTVGFTLAVREAILGKLSLFDDPAETWQSERLARLHTMLHDHFDIRKRALALHEKVTFLADLNQMLMTLLQNRTSHRLEWIVIMLIVIEVIFSCIHFVSALRGGS